MSSYEIMLWSVLIPQDKDEVRMFRELITNIKAEAWAEGHEAGCNRVPHFDNPHKED